MLPDTRQYQLSGTARIDPNAPDALLDTLLGTTAPGTEYTSSGHLKGDLDAPLVARIRRQPRDRVDRAARPAGRVSSSTSSLPAPLTVDALDLTVVADGRHPVPTALTLEGDGGAACAP